MSDTDSALRELARLELQAERIRRGRTAFAYVPHDLHAKQLEYAALTCPEALYGGAAGGGKTDALLAAALMGAKTPGYSGLLLRRTFPALSLPNALMDRAHRWLSKTDAHWDATHKQWRFPSGATLQFGYCDSKNDLDRYQSAEFQFVGIDELTEWPEGWYRFLFSRIRKLRGRDIPLRMRAATNPGGLGAEWVRQYFGIPENEVVHTRLRTVHTVNGKSTEAVFLPARVEDNPTLDLETYEESLARLGPQKYEQLRWGRWIRDGEGLVYAGFDRARNVMEALPPTDKQRPWSTLFALDFGVVDDNGIAVLKWRDKDPTCYVARAYRFHGGPSDMSDEVARLAREEDPVKVVGDLGGMGRAYDAEFRKRKSVPVVGAQKTQKVGYISFLNDDLRRGRIKVIGPMCADLLDEWGKLPWAEHAVGKREAEGFDNHASDAVLYGYREVPIWGIEAEEMKPRTREEIIREEVERAWEQTRRAVVREQADRLEQQGVDVPSGTFLREREATADEFAVSDAQFDVWGGG